MPDVTTLTQEQLDALLEKHEASGRVVYRSSFTPNNARKFKHYFDTMVQSGAAVIIKYEEFPRQNERTLYKNVNDALLWLSLRSDTAEERDRYALLKQSIRMKPIVEGILLLGRDVAKKPSGPATIVVNTVEWRSDMMAWLESAPEGAKFNRTNLNLSEEDITGVRSLLTEAGLAHNVTKQNITIIK